MIQLGLDSEALPDLPSFRPDRFRVDDYSAFIAEQESRRPAY